MLTQDQSVNVLLRIMLKVACSKLALCNDMQKIVIFCIFSANWGTMNIILPSPTCLAAAHRLTDSAGNGLAYKQHLDIAMHSMRAAP